MITGYFRTDLVYPMRNTFYACLPFAMFPISALAQDFSITEPTISTCSGFFYDTGGPGGGGYGNNQAFTSTICPPVEGQSVSLAFTGASLSLAGLSPVDHVTIHNGADTEAPVLGQFIGQGLQGEVFTANNATGCLTVVFVSNASGTGFFTGSIGCVESCPAPTAAFGPGTVDTLTLCQGLTTVLDGSASTAADGQGISSYIWSVGQTVLDTTTTPDLPHVFGPSGVYHATLRVVDDAGCASWHADTVLVLVSATPSFEGSHVSTPACAPAVVDLQGEAAPVPLFASPVECRDFSSALPDDVGPAFEFTIPVSTGSAGELVTSVEQIGSICLDLEHSFMGDLVIQVVCPSGESVMLHAQGGGPTFLGDANDSDSGDPVPGTCWTYCFSHDAQLGTWAECGVNGVTPNVTEVAQGMALIPGTYAPAGSLFDLIGCPVNGDWTIVVQDLWAADNGSFCGWCSGFIVPVDSSTLSISPVIHLSNPDSAYWTGVGVSGGPNPADATAGPLTGGAQEYTFSVIDSYGCPYDTTITALIYPSLLVEAGPDVTLCSDSVQLGVVVSSGPTPTCTYTLVLMDSDADGWSLGANLGVVLDGDTTRFYFATQGLSQEVITMDVLHGSSIELNYEAGAAFNQENSFDLFDAGGELLYASPGDPPSGVAYSGTIDCSGVPAAYQLEWSPAIGLSDIAIPDPLLFTGTSGWYTVSATSVELPFCSGVDSVWVEAGVAPLGIAWSEDDSTLCASLDTLITYEWWFNGTLQFATSTPCLSVPEAGTWYVEGAGSGECAYVSDAVDVQYDSATSVEERTDAGSLAVFPVPTGGELTLRAGGLKGTEVIVRISDMSGRSVFERRLKPSGGAVDVAMDLPLKPGSYLLLLQDDRAAQVKKVVVR